MQGGAILADINGFARKQINNKLIELGFARTYKQLGPGRSINPLVSGVEHDIDCGMAVFGYGDGL
jgi:hypothetical protein